MATTKNYLIELGPGGRQIKMRGLEVKTGTFVISAMSYSDQVLADIEAGEGKQFTFGVGDTINLEEILYQTSTNFEGGESMIRDLTTTDRKQQLIGITPALDEKFKTRSDAEELAFRLRTEAGFASAEAAKELEAIESAKEARSLRSKSMSITLEIARLEKNLDIATEAQALAYEEYNKFDAKTKDKIKDLKSQQEALKASMEKAGIEVIEIKEAGDPLPAQEAPAGPSKGGRG